MLPQAELSVDVDYNKLILMPEHKGHQDYILFVPFVPVVVQGLAGRIFSTPPMNGTSAFGTVTDPSAFW